MDALSKFQKNVENPIWTQERTTTYNMLCMQTDCYQNCGEYRRLSSILDLFVLRLYSAMGGRTCKVCYHSFGSHHYSRLKWVPKEEEVNPEMKERYENAKSDRERKEVLLAGCKKELDASNRRIEDGTKELAQLAEDYAELSLSGSFSADVEKAVRLLQQSYKGMEEKGVDQEQLQKMKECLDMMEKKLKILKDAKEKTQKESVGIGAKVKEHFGKVKDFVTRSSDIPR